MKTFVQEGNVITLTLVKDQLSGEVVAIGELTGVAVTSGVIGDEVEVAMTGVYTITVPTALVIATGEVLYVTAGGVISKTASGNTRVGVAVTASANGEVTVQVRLQA